MKAQFVNESISRCIQWNILMVFEVKDLVTGRKSNFRIWLKHSQFSVTMHNALTMQQTAKPTEIINHYLVLTGWQFILSPLSRCLTFFFKYLFRLHIIEYNLYEPPLLPYGHTSVPISSTSYLSTPPALFCVYLYSPPPLLFSHNVISSPPTKSYSISKCFPLSSFPREIYSAVEARRIAFCSERMCIIVERPCHGLFPRKEYTVPQRHQCNSNKHLTDTFIGPPFCWAIIHWKSKVNYIIILFCL